MKKLFLSLASLAIGLLLAFGLGEIGVRLSVPETMFWPISNIYRPHPDPDIVYTYRRGYQGQNFGTTIAINSHGFRGPDWAAEKPEDGYRIVLIGDSVTFGFGVEYDQTYGAVLAEILAATSGQPVEVINLGVNGYNSRQERAVVEKLALPLQPDLIIQLVVGNDDDDALTVDAEGWLRSDKNDQTGLSRIKDPTLEDDVNTAHKTEQESHFLATHSRLYLFIKIMLTRFESRKAPVGQDAAAGDIPSHQLPPIDGEIAEELRTPVFVPLQETIQATQAAGVHYILASGVPRRNYRTTLKALAEQTGVPFVEILTLLKQYNSNEEFRQKYTLGWDPHPNPQAHELYGQGLAALVLQQGLIQHARK